MRSGFSLGRIFGIKIRIDWSWLFIFFLITWNLSTAFGVLHPDWGMGSSLILAVVAALLFFASVLAHELAHSVMAQARGIPVRSITLFLFGGVSNIERDPDSPQSEFLITIVGPITSFIIGGLLLWVVSLMRPPLETAAPTAHDMLAPLNPLSTLLLWLGSINLLLGGFNLIPGFPLDGGRILRSVLWAVTGNLRLATRWAAGVGQVVAWLLILAGIAMVFGLELPFFGTGLIGGLWLAFIGWFLNSAAIQSYERVVIQDVLEDVPVWRMVRSDPPTVLPGISIDQLVYDHVMRTDEYAFPVMEGERLVGLVTLQDVRSVPRDAWVSTYVHQIMTPFDQLVVTHPDEAATAAWEKLLQRDVRQLPVMRGETLVGLLRRQDIVKWLQLGAEFTRGRR